MASTLGGVAASLRRGLAEPLWAAYSRTPLLSEWRELEATQFLPAAELAARQWRRLLGLLDVAGRTSAFYRRRFAEAGFSAADMTSPADLRRLPILTKDDVREHVDELIADGLSKDRLLHFKTGGSTGKALHLFFTEDVSERRNAAARRSNRWAGWEVGEPVGAAWGNPERPSTLKAILRDRLLGPTIYLDTMQVDEGAVRTFAREWRSARPTMLFGHAHSIYILARMCRDLGVTDIAPRAIISTSMMLLPHERAEIEAVFGTRVSDRYGCEEVGLIAAECEQHRGMHLNVDHLFVELVRRDGSLPDPGEPADIVVTDLVNHAMPMIRYRIEDVVEPMAGRCPCGRGLPLIGKVAGRVADFLVRNDGARVAGISLIENSLTRIPGIVQMQIVQDAIDHLVLNVVGSPQFEAARRAELLEYFRSVFPGAAIELRDVAEIPQEANGKYRFSINRVPA